MDSVHPEDMATGMRTFFGPDGVDRVPQDAAVRLIRAALGDGVPVDDFPSISVSQSAHSFVGLALDFAFDQDKLHAVLRQAEDIARNAGFNPTDAVEPHSR